MKSNQALKSRWSLGSFFRLVGHLSPRRRRQMILLSALSTLSAAGEVSNLAILFFFLRLLENPSEASNSIGFLSSLLSEYGEGGLVSIVGVCFLFTVVMSSSLRILNLNYSLRLAAKITLDVGKKVFEATLGQPYSWHLNNNSKSTLNLLVQDINQAQMVFQTQLRMPVNILVILMIASSLIAIDATIMLTMAVLLSTVYLVIYRFTRATLAVEGAVRRKSNGAKIQTIQEGLNGIRDIILDRTHALFLDEFNIYDNQSRRASYRIALKVQMIPFMIEGMTLLVIFGIAFWYSFGGKSGDQIFPLLGTFALGFYRMLKPIQQCFSAFASLKSGEPSILKIVQCLDLGNPKVQESKIEVDAARYSSGLAPEISLENVWFRYHDEAEWVLKDLSIEIPAGSRVGFVGSTGSGKSTTIDLILGLLIPQKGNVLVDGNSLSERSTLRAWHDQVAHVPQQIHLSDTSLGENIAFGVPRNAIDWERVKQAAHRACIDDFIEAQPEGYETRVGERGVRLSGGQRQRLGIARALYKRSHAIIFDEATSALDNRTEQQVISSISNLEKRVTVIMIAHRLSTVRDCDCIFHMEQGKLVACGRYDELLNESESFRKLAKNL
ncbi:MAG: ABC transporter ATP-binding protein [Cyanobacteria bacterium P01_F01_bin.33]